MSEYFHESHWGQCLELLTHLCQYSDSIILVTGSEGIGKTAMKQAFMAQEAQQYVFCEVQAMPSLTAEQITARIDQDLALVDEQDLVLVIDDAQFLALDVLAMILQLKQKTASEGRLHIVLFADATLEQKIARSVLKEDFAEQVHTIEIEPMTDLEMEAFLRQQWRLQHQNNDMPFNRAKCKKIHALTGGIAGKVQEVTEAMLAGKTTKSGVSQALSPFTVGVTVSFGILFCILAILWPATDKNIVTKSEANSAQPLPLAKLEENIAAHEIAATSEEPLETKTVEVDHVLDPAPVVELATAPLQINPPTAAQSEEAVVASTKENYQERIANLEKKDCRIAATIIPRAKSITSCGSEIATIKW